MISSIIHREFLEVSSNIAIAWTPCDDELFTYFVKTVCFPCNLISLSETYYGITDISIIICNNRLTHLDKSIELAKFLSCPLLIIDHQIKSDMVANNFDYNIPIEPIYQIALSQQIFTSWNRIHNSTMKYDINDEINKNTWKNLIYQLSKSNMVIKDEQIIKK